MSNSLFRDIIKHIIKPEFIKVEINFINFSADIEKYPSKKWNDILNKLAQNKSKTSEKEVLKILKQILEAQRCEIFESKRILKLYEQEVRINTHFV